MPKQATHPMLVRAEALAYCLGAVEKTPIQEGKQVNTRVLAIFSSAVLLACTETAGLEGANKQIEELQMKVVDLQTEISHLRKTNAELNAQLQGRRQ